MTNLDSVLKRRDITLPTNLHSQSYGFSSSHVWIWELDQEGQVLKNWCFWIVVLETTLGSRLDSKEIKPVNPKGNQSWIFTGRTDAEAEAPVLWSSDAKGWLVVKDPDSGENVNLRLGLDPMCRGSDPAKTLLETWTHNLLLRITHLVSGHTEAQDLCVSLQKEFSEKQSVRRGFYSGKNILHRQSVSHHRGWMLPWNMVWLASMGWVIS